MGSSLMRYSPGQHRQKPPRIANAHQRASNRDDAGGKRLQPWERQAVIDAYRDGEKLEAIAAEFNCSGAAVSQLAKRAGLPRRGGSLGRHPPGYPPF
jgi:hypothetical protein